MTEDVLLRSVTYRLGSTNKPPTVEYLLRIGPVDTATNTFHPMFEETITQDIDWGIKGETTDTYGTWTLGAPVTLPALPEGVVYDSQNQVSYLLNFDEAVDESTIDLADFENLGSGVSLDSLVSVTNDGLFPLASTVQVVFGISGTGTLQLGLTSGSDVADFYGNAVAGPVADDTTISVALDTTAPMVGPLSPANGASEVDLQPTLVLGFTDQSGIDLGTGIIEIKDAADDQVLQTIDVTAGDVVMTGPQEATITVPSSLSFGQTVYVNMPAGTFVDLSGNPFGGIADETTWSFSTLALPTPDGPISAFAAASAGESLPFETDPEPLTHTFDIFPRLSADHLPASTSDIQLSAGRHLVIYNSRFDSTGGSNRSEVQTHLNLDGTALAAGWSQGYIRRSGPYETITAGGAIIDAAGGEILQLQSFRTDTNSGASVVRADSVTNSTSGHDDPGPVPGESGATGIQLLKLGDWPYLNIAGHDGTGTDQALLNNSDPTPVVYNDVPGTVDPAFGITAGSSDVTLNEPGRYLVLANSYVNGNSFGGRESVIQSITLDGVEVPESRTNAYLRDNDGAFQGAPSVGLIIEASAGQVLDVILRKQGGRADGFIVGGRTALNIVQLPASAEVLRLTDDTGQNINAEAPLLYGTRDGSLPASFSHDTATDSDRIGVNAGGDYLFLADGNASGVENYFGTDPSEFTEGILELAVTASTVTFSHPPNANPADDIEAGYIWSEDLVTFHADGADNGSGTTVSFAQGAPSDGMVTVTVTFSGPVPEKLFVAVEVTQAP